MVHMGLGEPEEALWWLETAWKEGDQRARVVAVDPRFERLRGDPRFEDLVARFGLSSASGPPPSSRRAVD